MYKFVKWFLLFIVPFGLDRWTKYLVLTETLQSSIVNQFFNVYVTFNRGIAWGIGSELQNSYTMMLHLFIACVLIYFAYFMKQMMHSRCMTIACMLVLSGGISNFIDRVYYGSVIDFLQFHYGDWFFPVFNVADVSITIGAILMICCMYLQRER